MPYTQLGQYAQIIHVSGIDTFHVCIYAYAYAWTSPNYAHLYIACLCRFIWTMGYPYAYDYTYAYDMLWLLKYTFYANVYVHDTCSVLYYSVLAPLSFDQTLVGLGWRGFSIMFMN